MYLATYILAIILLCISACDVTHPAHTHTCIHIHTHTHKHTHDHLRIFVRNKALT